MSCPRCRSERLFQFQAPTDLPARPTDLPAVCRDCGCISIAGQAVPFPVELEQHAKGQADRAVELAHEAVEGLEREPTQERVTQYFVRVYRRGFMDGFWRALAWFRHHAKEGRLSRLRALWTNARVPGPMNRTVVLHPDERVVVFTQEEYREFEYLLHLGAKEPPNASDPANEHPAVS